jgi:uncharacterized protein
MRLSQKPIQFFSALLLVGGVGCGQPQPAQLEKSLLWEISGQGLTQPSYLYGTMHLTCPNQLVVPAKLQEKLATTKQLYLELDMDDPNLPIAMLQNSAQKDGSTLKTLLSPEDYAIASQFFQQNVGIPLDKVGSMKPIILIGLLYPSLLGCQPGSWEATLIQLARTRNSEVLGLETVQAQFAIFDQIPAKDQAAMVMEVVRDPANAKQELQKLLAAYQAQDVNELYRMVAEASPTEARFEQVLLKDRNQRWIPAIAQAAQAKPTFFAVGAGHLGGQNGVIPLLRQAGYTVKPVPLNPTSP